MEDREDKITALLSLKSRLEQDLRADMIKIKDLEKECALKRKWIHYLDETLSESSFQPASALISDFDEAKLNVPYKEEIVEEIAEGLPSTVNIKGIGDGTLLATVNFFEGNISIAFNDTIQVSSDDPQFIGFQESTLSKLEKKGSKIFFETDEGILKSITILGEFNIEIGSEVVESLDKILNTIHKN
ncbi:MAG: hypothetical protein ACFFCS_21870 [Candidatus Hodarchaeota archaeon]